MKNSDHFPAKVCIITALLLGILCASCATNSQPASESVVEATKARSGAAASQQYTTSQQQAPVQQPAPEYITGTPGSVVINPKSQSAVLAGQFNLKVEVTPDDWGLSAAELQLSFDANALEGLNIQPGDALGDNPITGAQKIDNDSGTITYALARVGETPKPGSQGVIASIDFKVKSGSAGITEVKIVKAGLADESFKDIQGIKCSSAAIGLNGQIPATASAGNAPAVQNTASLKPVQFASPSSVESIVPSPVRSFESGTAVTIPAIPQEGTAVQSFDLGNIPVYPGAKLTSKKLDRQNGEEERFYESGDDLSSLVVFYQQEMPAKGWREIDSLEYPGESWDTDYDNMNGNEARVKLSSNGRTVEIYLYLHVVTGSEEAVSAVTPPDVGSDAPQNWMDMPVFPGANLTCKKTLSLENEEERYYETRDNLASLITFYQQEMPDKGWREIDNLEYPGESWDTDYDNNNGDKARVKLSYDGKMVELYLDKKTVRR
ncbi:MAG: hypothetical protein JXA46_10495 [Dehalococcoidales bacterium]|nr:hypothetical protein [Dehalococcoidales bacterium]